MKSRIFALVCLYLAAAAVLAEEPAADLKALEGTWKVERLEVRGNETMPTAGMPDQVVVWDGKATFFSQGRELPTFRRMFMTTDVRPNSLNLVRNLEVLPCLFEVTDDEWKLAMPMVTMPRGREILTRPESLDSTDKPVVILVMKRGKQ